jgi:hypothetical protein
MTPREREAHHEQGIIASTAVPPEIHGESAATFLGFRRPRIRCPAVSS